MYTAQSAADQVTDTHEHGEKGVGAVSIFFGENIGNESSEWCLNGLNAKIEAKEARNGDNDCDGGLEGGWNEEIREAVSI